MFVEIKNANLKIQYLENIYDVDCYVVTFKVERINKKFKSNCQ